MKTKSIKKYIPVLVLFLILNLSVTASGGPSIPGFYGSVQNLPSVLPNALPTGGNVIQGAVIGQPFNNKLEIYQNQPKAIVEWQKFDIGKEAWTHFNQQGNPDWVALNRIYDQNPSQIFGKLTADGKVYLINQNGILFTPGSQVNVHSLIASSLNTTNNNFLNGVLNFKAEDYAGFGGSGHLGSVVSNHGDIETGALGEVFLIAPAVENNGTIISPAGQVGLAAGTEVDVYREPTRRSALIVNVKAGAGVAGNFENGWILTDAGLAGMYGRVVNQEGLIRSITAVKKKGEIELCASDKVLTGAKSVTSVDVSDSAEKVNESFKFQPGEIRIQGLDPDPNHYAGVKNLEHRGVMEAPSGLISITAEERVYMENGSVTDVSGKWIDSKADGNVIESQLNSVELRDDYGQKGSLLNNLKIRFDAYLGSAIGDVSGALKSRDVTALEQATKGGTITIKGDSPQGQGLEELIIRDDALISFAGGGTRYAAGQIETTKLKAGNRVFDISEAPEYLDYDGVLGLNRNVYKRFGVTEEFKGLYAGGANSIMNFSGGRVEGDDAGTLQLMAGRIVLDGRLDGSVLKSIFQTEEEEPTDEQGNQTATGWKEPRAGMLQLGINDPDITPTEIDYSLYGTVIRSDVAPLPSGFRPEEALPGTGADALKSYFSSKTLSAAGLGALKIFTNTGFTTEKDAVLSLKPGSEMSVIARTIDHEGAIENPGGSVSLTVKDNITTDSVPLAGDGRVFLASGSKLVTAGERIDNFESVNTSGNLVTAGRLDGGSVFISTEATNGGDVIVSKDALIDVSGGYLIDEKGAVSGGDAGSIGIALKSNGKGALILDGDLRGYSIPGKKGGNISILAKQISVEQSDSSIPVSLDFDSPIPAELAEKFVLGKDWLDTTGFTNISLTANYGLEVMPGVRLSPSTVKMAQPVVMAKGKDAGSVLNSIYNVEKSNNELITVDPEIMGASSVTLRAGQDDGLSNSGANDNSMLDIGIGSMVGVGPAGKIRMEAPGISVAGHLDAPGGTIDLKAAGSNEGFRDLTISTGAVLSARGYNKPESRSVMKGYPAGYTPVNAGKINLGASQGSLILDSGSLVDISGSEPVKTYVKSSIYGMLPSEYTVAGEPGGLSLGFYNDLVMDGAIYAHAGMQGLKGGSLSLSRTHNADGFILSPEDIESFKSHGFDSLALQSKKSLAFSGDAVIDMGRYLILDAPEILGSDNQHLSILSPWVRIINDPAKYGSNDNPYDTIPAAASPGTGTLSVAADWIDIEGSMALSGFGDVSLEAANDIRVSDKVYSDISSNTYHWAGIMKTPGDLLLRAERIYPATLSEFTFLAAGRASILPGGGADKNPVYSAGGSLTIKAASIEHQGFLAAPFGQIRLESTAPGGRVYLSEKSVTTVAGADSVKYGDLAGEFWQAPDRSATGGASVTRDITKIPAKSVNIDGDEVIVKEGALVDLAGGGSVLTYEFLPSPLGSENPLARAGRYVILPDNFVKLPGDAVYLEGGNGIPAGAYSLLPEEYAFVPGAMILTDLKKAGQSYVQGNKLSEDGYPVVAGYKVIRGTDVKALNPAGYSIRSAENVRNEGYFNVRALAGGDAGSLSITGDTTILGGTFRIKALPGFEKGMITLAGKRVEMGDISGILPAGFDFNTVIPAGLEDKLLIQKDIFDEMDLREIVLGDTERTQVVDLKEGSSIRAEQVTLKAGDEIILRSGAEIHAVSDTGSGTASLIVPDPDNDGTGRVTLEPGSLVHASDEVILDLKTIDYRGDIRVDHSEITLGAREIFFVPEAYELPENPDGFYIRQSNWDKFSLFEKIGLKSDTSINFSGDFDLHAAELLSLDSSRITGKGTDPVTDPWADVTLRAPVISLLYSGDSPLTGTSLSETGAMNLIGNEVRVGSGQVLLDGFSQTNIASQGDTIFQGKGSLTTQGDLNITAARATTAYSRDSAGKYEAADFSVNTGTGAIAIHSNGNAPVAGIIPGGTLNLTARRIDIDGILETASVRLNINATGTGTQDGVFLHETGRIIDRGSKYGPGGSVELRSDLGNIDLAEGSLIDVSAGMQGDAGSISLYGPQQNIKTNGSLMGYGIEDGDGGSFYADTGELTSFNNLYEKLAAGGFNNEINVRARTGDITIGSSSPAAPEQLVRAKDLKVVSDDGAIFLQQNAYIDLSGDEAGGSAELYGKDAVVLFGGSRIHAKGTGAGADGGDVTLGTSDGYVVLLQDSEIDVSDNGGKGGTVYLRAPRSANDVLLYPLGGTIRGASGVYAEAFTTYTDTSITTSDTNTWKTQTQTYMNNAGTIENRLLSGMALQQKNGAPDTPDKLHLTPGIEIRSAGDLTLANDWNLTTWRFGGEPGVLTLRSAGNLSLNANLTDKPNENPSPGSVRDSWAVNLAAGADRNSADILAVQEGTGTLSFADSKAAYTESAPLRFASGGDMNVGLGQVLSSNTAWWALKESFNLGTFDGSIEGKAEGALNLNGGAILSGTGDIDITVGKDLLISKGTSSIPGAILSMGRSTETGTLRYRRRDAGDISLEVEGNIESKVPLKEYPWDFNYSKRADGGASDWGPSLKDQGSFGTKANADIRGLATLGGGNLDIDAGGFFRATAGSFGYMKAVRENTGGAWEYSTEQMGEGDLKLYAGGDVTGRFLIMSGDADINAMGGIVEYKQEGSPAIRTVLEGFDARFNVSGQGDVNMGTILNPTLVAGQNLFLYSDKASASITSALGNVLFNGDSPFVSDSRENTVPPALGIEAAGNIRLLSSLTLAPSPTGNLRLMAGGDIEGYKQGTTTLERNTIYMSDIADAFSKSNPGITSASQDLIHDDDPTPVDVQAGGDIKGLKLYIPKTAQIRAAGDIYDVYLGAQNLGSADMTIVKAGGNIIFPERGGLLQSYDSGFEVAGPGFFTVQAGGDISLGDARVGIRTIGGTVNSKLGNKGSALVVAAGFDNNLYAENMAGFFGGLREGIDQYTSLLAAGSNDEADKVVQKIRAEFVSPMLGEGNTGGGGDILMLNSQISTLSGDDPIFILSNGRIDVGRTTFFKAEEDRANTGIYTAGSGDINILTAGDVNVNESRIMTFMGGDITIWANDGVINAGRGSKAVVSASPPTVNEETGEITFKPPAVGSGIRTLTFDPDGEGGPLNAPDAGDVHLYAKVIDAGEAGIAGKNVFLGSTTVLNAQNISFTGTGVGVPSSSEGVNLGSLAGAGALAETNKLSEQTANLASEKGEAANQAKKLSNALTALNDLFVKWLDVKIISFETKSVDGEDKS